MSRFYSYLHTATRIIGQYKGDIPLAIWLKDFFRQHKQMGSKDRKMVGELVYQYYRLGHAAAALPVEERLLLAIFMCTSVSHPLLEHVKPSWNLSAALPLTEKTALPEISATGFQLAEVFPWQEALSEGLDKAAFTASFLQQPDLFLRLRPGREDAVREKLSKVGIAFEALSRTCLRLPNATKLEGVVESDREAVVQDYSSQLTGEYFFDESSHNSPQVWDCCAASGGKSLMAYDRKPKLQLTVSDVRSSILLNLATRFQKAGIGNYASFVADLSKGDTGVNARLYDLIIADVPCSGSGTWARTPEQLYFFDAEKISYYSQLQKKIVQTAVSRLKKGGRMVYITCSVFRQENEEMVQFASGPLGLQVKSTRLLTGYPVKADSMFVSVWEKA